MPKVTVTGEGCRAWHVVTADTLAVTRGNRISRYPPIGANQENSVATLDRWKHLLLGPGRIAFPRLRLQGRDSDPPVLEGSGELCFEDLSGFEFTLRGKPTDLAFAEGQFDFRELNPYDPPTRFRLFGTDTDGAHWALGSTVPRVDSTHEEWVLEGELDGISTIDDSSGVVDIPSTELLFVIPPQHPLLLSATSTGLDKKARMRVLESEVSIFYDAPHQALSITATHSQHLPATYTENWLGEPLRILFGQLMYPRLVARNLGGRRSYIFLRRAHRVSEHRNTLGLGFDSG